MINTQIIRVLDFHSISHKIVNGILFGEEVFSSGPSSWKSMQNISLHNLKEWLGY